MGATWVSTMLQRTKIAKWAKNSDSAQLFMGPSDLNDQGLVRILLVRSTFRSLLLKFEWKELMLEYSVGLVGWNYYNRGRS